MLHKRRSHRSWTEGSLSLWAVLLPCQSSPKHTSRTPLVIGRWYAPEAAVYELLGKLTIANW